MNHSACAVRSLTLDQHQYCHKLDSEDFFTNAVQEFGVPGATKEALADGLRRPMHEPPNGYALHVAAASPALVEDRWALASEGSPWQLVDIESHVVESSNHAADHPHPSRVPASHTAGSVAVRAHSTQTDAPIPSSQSARTPEPFISELAPLAPLTTSHALLEEGVTLIPTSMVPTTPRSTTSEITPALYWADNQEARAEAVARLMQEAGRLARPAH